MGDIGQAGDRADGRRAEVTEHPDERFFELTVDGERAGVVVYEAAGGRYVLTHTVIAEGYQGQGFTQVLLRGVLDDLRARQITVTNYCPVVGHFIELHPEYRSALDQDRPGSWGARPQAPGQAEGGSPAGTSA
jgi:predicted GNAT family acetyltransferase